MESGSLSNMPALRNLCSPFSFWRSHSNRTPQDHAGSPRSPTRDYEKWKNEMMEKPQIRRIFYIMELDMLLLNLMKLNTDMLKTESIQNQLNQLVELIKLNVNLLIHEPDLLMDLKELDDPLVASHTTDQASTQDDDPLRNIKNIYRTLEKAKAGENLIEETRKLISQAESQLKRIKVLNDQLENANATTGQVDQFDDITKLIQQCHDEFQDEHQLAPSGSSMDPNRLNNDVAKHIVNLLPVELRPPAELRAASAKSNLNLVKWNLEEIHLILNHNLILVTEEPHESNSNQKSLTEKLIKVTNNLISQISIVDNLSNPQDDGNREQIIKSHAARIIELMCSPNTELYIDRMDSFKDICNQVAAMYKHSYYQKVIIKKSERERRTDENYTWCGSFHKDIFNEIRIVENYTWCGSFHKDIFNERTDKNYTWCGSFHKDIFNGNCEGVEKFLKENPLALTAKITVDGNTALHVAVKAMKEEIVEKLLQKLTEEKKFEETLKKQNEEGKTPLYIAASSGRKPIIEKLVKDNEHTLLVECEPNNSLPIFVAAKYDDNAMVNYIYKKMQDYKKKKESSGEDTKVECFPSQNDPKAKVWMTPWALFLANLIYNDDYDMALDIIRDFPSLALYKYKNMESPLFVLAQRRSLGTDVKFRAKASKLLERIILNIDDLKSQKPALSAAFFKAAEVGSVKFVAIFINSLPLVLSWLNDLHQNIFHVAIINRQENIFNLIYGMGSVKNDLTGSADKLNNWMLHLAGVIAPPNRLNELPGPATQLQRELQWFEAVKKIVPNLSIDAKNLSVDGKTTPEFTNRTPSELFTSTHEVLMKDAQEWMRNTASQCSVVAALITTVMFAVAFTLPGGNDQNTGDPIFLGDTSFLLFAAADFVALLTSCTSVLIFLAILTSRFSQGDFLKSLPMRLFRGLVFLFVAMAAMIFAFCDTIYIVIRNRYNWIYIPTILVGSTPVLIFWCMMFPLLFDLWRATKISIFNKSTRTPVYY